MGTDPDTDLAVLKIDADAAAPTRSSLRIGARFASVTR